jgi:hypothetical protein
MTIPDAVRALYTINARELDIDRLLWEKPFRVTMLELLAAQIPAAFGGDTRLELVAVHEVVDNETGTADPERAKLLVRIHTALRDWALRDAAVSFMDMKQRTHYYEEGIMWHTVPFPPPSPEVTASIPERLKRRDG